MIGPINIKLLAVGLCASTALCFGAYSKGRIDGWQRYAKAEKEAAYALLTDRMDDFLRDLETNTADGDLARAEITGAVTAIDEARHAIFEASSAFNCPSDPTVSMHVDTAQAAVAAAIDRAAGRGAVDPTDQREPSDSPAP